MSSGVVERWFGAHFDALHPKLQALHRHGGVLAGDVSIEVGRGIAGWLCHRIGRAIGVPTDEPVRGFSVTISHTADALLWRRDFDAAAAMVSTFLPVGRWPDGYWIERTGAIALHLGVDVIDGGWIWRTRRAYWHGLRVPLWLLPRTHAGKRVVDDRYVFFVALRLPMLGEVLSYRGELGIVG